LVEVGVIEGEGVGDGGGVGVAEAVEVAEGVAAAVGEVLGVSEAVAVADADPLEALLAETALLPEGGAVGSDDCEALRAGEEDTEGHMDTLREDLGEALTEALPR